MCGLSNTLDIPIAVIHQTIEFLEENGIDVAITDCRVIAVCRRHGRLIPHTRIVRQQTYCTVGRQLHDSRESITGIMQTRSAGIYGQQTGVHQHLAVRRGRTYDLGMNTVGVEDVVILRQAIQIRHDLRRKHPVFQTL